MNKNAYPSNPAGTGGQELLTPGEAAVYLRVSKSYLDKLRVYGGGPRFLRPGKRKILYRKSDLDAWLGSQSFDSTSEYQRLGPSATEEPYNTQQRNARNETASTKD
jgi:excisionase family DNA binding protein